MSLEQFLMASKARSGSKKLGNVLCSIFHEWMETYKVKIKRQINSSFRNYMRFTESLLNF